VNFCTCSPTSLGQDLTIIIPKNDYYFWFGLLELKMADLSIFFEKNYLRPLGVKTKDS
jgi:hypothetical protein